MKKLILPVTIISFVGIVILSTSYRQFERHSKPLTTVTYYYYGDDQQIDSGYSGQSDPRENSLTESSFTNGANWSTNSKPECGCTGGKYICSLEFSHETVEDGGCDGMLSFHEAKMAVWYYWLGHGFTLPPNGGTITECNTVITIRLSCTVH